MTLDIKTFILIALLSSARVVSGIPFLPFPGWNAVKDISPDIIIARCIKTVNDPAKNSRALIDSDIQIVSVLKGITNRGPARLGSIYWPRQGEQYLIFSIYHDGFYQASEAYRIVPLGAYVPPDLLTGKTLDENIQILFRWSIDHLNRQIKEEQEEKQRLEEGLKK